MSGAAISDPVEALASSLALHCAWSGDFDVDSDALPSTKRENRSRGSNCRGLIDHTAGSVLWSSTNSTASYGE